MVTNRKPMPRKPTRMEVVTVHLLTGSLRNLNRTKRIAP